MHVDEQQILSISRDLWTTQLGLTIAPEEANGTHPGDDRTLASCVKVSGAWRGAILVECPESVARHAAAMLFAADGESDEDVQDALGELAEMIARKMRPLLPDETKLSRSSIVSDEEALSRMKGVSDLKLSCEGRPVRIALFESDLEPAPAV
jgi:hypothetical protein